jgi:hypothetical protein
LNLNRFSCTTFVAFQRLFKTNARCLYMTDTLIHSASPYLPIAPEVVPDDSSAVLNLPFKGFSPPLHTATHLQTVEPGSFTGLNRNITDTDWMTVALLAAFVVFTFVRYNFPKRLAEFVKATLIPRFAPLLVKKNNPRYEQITIALMFNYFLTSSLFLYLILDHFEWLPTGLVENYWLYVSIFVVNFTYWLGKNMVSAILAHIFKSYETNENYLLNTLLFNMTLGLLLLFLLPFAIYTGYEPVFLATTGLVFLLLAYRILRGVVAGLSSRTYPPFYLFLYICTLEVAPLLVIAKYFMSHSGV